MKFRTTLILVGILAVLLAFVLLFEKKGKGDKTEKLVDLPSTDVEQITFKQKNETFTFKKDDKGDWLITEPLEAKADTYEVNRLVEDFSDLKIERVVEETPGDITTYDIPQKEVTLWYKGMEQPVKILVGMENPLDNTFFAQKEGETRVVLIPSMLKSLLEKTLIDFRKKDIFQFETDDVKDISLRAKDIRWQASKKEDEWFFEKPLAALAQKSRLENILNSLSGLRAKEFISEDKTPDETKTHGLDKPDYEITLGLPLENKTVTFFLHKVDDILYATTSDSPKIVTAETSVLTDFEKQVEELREKKVASFYSWEANKLSLTRGELNLTLAKDSEGKWIFEAGESGEAEGSKIETFLRKVETLEAKEFIDSPKNLADFRLDSPQAEVKIWIKEDEEKVKEVTILVGSEDADKKEAVVKNSRLDYLFRVDSGFLQEFPKQASDWKKEEIPEKQGK